MTDRIALALGAVILTLAALDLAANGGEVLLFLAHKTFDLIEYVSVWR